MFSLYLARCCHAPASTLNCSIWSSSSIFLLLMFSTSVSFSRSFWRTLSSMIETLWSCVAELSLRLFAAIVHPIREKIN
jgi:hypothetical protein